jgi:hypothetical protein
MHRPDRKTIHPPTPTRSDALCEPGWQSIRAAWRRGQTGPRVGRRVAALALVASVLMSTSATETAL